MYDPSSPVNDATCALSNVPQPLTVPTAVPAPCKYQYQYLVAVVATGKDASLLMQLQSYQMQMGQYLKLSLASIVLLASVFMFY